jgi:hypothetical protein
MDIKKAVSNNMEQVYNVRIFYLPTTVHKRTIPQYEKEHTVCLTKIRTGDLSRF